MTDDTGTRKVLYYIHATTHCVHRTALKLKGDLKAYYDSRDMKCKNVSKMLRGIKGRGSGRSRCWRICTDEKAVRGGGEGASDIGHGQRIDVLFMEKGRWRYTLCNN